MLTRDQFWEKGYEIFPSFLDPADVEDGIFAVDTWAKPYNPSGYLFIQNVYEDPIFKTLSMRPAILDQLSVFLDGKLEVYNSTALVTYPEKKSPEANNWHIDKNAPDGHGVKILFYFTDVSKENCGNTYIKPGSCGLPKNPDLPSVQVTCPAGSIMIYRTDLWHSPSVNTSKVVRKALFLSYKKIS